MAERRREPPGYPLHRALEDRKKQQESARDLLARRLKALGQEQQKLEELRARRLLVQGDLEAAREKLHDTPDPAGLPQREFRRRKETIALLERRLGENRRREESQAHAVEEAASEVESARQALERARQALRAIEQHRQVWFERPSHTLRSREQQLLDELAKNPFLGKKRKKDDEEE